MPPVVTNGWVTTLASGSDFPHSLVFAGGYIWIGSESVPGRLSRIDPANPSVVTTFVLPNDGQHNWVIDMNYIPAKGKIYGLCVSPFDPNAVTTVIEINPSTGAFTDVIVDASFSAGQGALTFDGTYLYILSWFTNSIYRYSLSGFGFVSSVSTSLPNAHALRYDSASGNIFATSAANLTGYPMIAQVGASTFTVDHLGFWELDKIFTDDVAIANGYVWCGSEGSGNIVKFPTSNVSSGIVRVTTGIESAGGNHAFFKRNFGTYFDGGVIWTGWEGNPAIIGRVNVTTNLVELMELPLITQASPNEFVRNGSSLYITDYTQPGVVSQLTVENFDPPTSPSFISVSDTLALSDAVLQGDIEHPGVGVGDSLNIRDSIRTSYPQFNPLVDTIALSDAMTFVVGMRVSVTDTISLLDNGSGFTTFFSDTLTLTDAVAISINLPALVSLTVSVSDTLGLLDSLSYVYPPEMVFVTDSLFLRERVGVVMGSTRDGYLRRYLNDVIRF